MPCIALEYLEDGVDRRHRARRIGVIASSACKRGLGAGKIVLLEPVAKL